MTAISYSLPPRLIEATDLLGEYQGSGRVSGSYLLRRGDGRMLEVSPLVYLVAASCDGSHDLDAIACRVAGQSARPVSAANVAYLLEHKLAPLGVLAGTGAGAASEASRPPRSCRPRTKRARPLLSLTLHTAVVPKDLVRRATWLFLPFFWAPVVVGVLIALVGLDTWLAMGPGLHAGLHDVVYQPAWLLAVTAMVVAAGLFHELGHATASRYGGAEAGAIGVGLYLFWPAFSNDLNDSYRLSRTGRLRADLGGIYFNVVVILALGCAYAFTGLAPLLVVIAIQHLAILQQFLPFLRLDGYYVVGDLVGIPDLFAYIRPVLSGLIRRRPAAPPGHGLKPVARAVVSAWVLVSVPLLAAGVVLLGLRLPTLAHAGWGSFGRQARALGAATRAGDLLSGLVSLVGLATLALPGVGAALTVFRLGRHLRRPGIGGPAAITAGVQP